MGTTFYDYETPKATYKVYLEKRKYANGRTVLLLMDKTGKEVACATCNLNEPELGPDADMWVKTWDGNEFMMRFLNKNYLVRDTGIDAPCGMHMARAVKLLV
jgi:hypothetical protein